MQTRTPSRAFAVIGVFLLMSGLVLGLFDEARAVSMDFSVAPKVVVGDGDFLLDVLIPAGERVPIERITAIIEKRADRASDKSGASTVTRATCDFAGIVGSECGPDDLTRTGPAAGAVTRIAFAGFFGASSGDELAPEGSFGYGALLGTTTGYGYDASGIYGYGYDLGTPANFNAGTGYGYGRTDGQDMALRFAIRVSGPALDRGIHYLTVLAHTGSSIIGDMSSPYTEFRVVPQGGGGGGGLVVPDPPRPNRPVTQTVQVTPVDPPGGASAAFRADAVTTAAGDTVVLQTTSERVPSISLIADMVLNDATIDVVLFEPDAAPSSVGTLPAGVRAVQFIQVTISSGGESHAIEFVVVLPEGDDVDPSKAVLVKWDPDAQTWQPRGRVAFNPDGTGRARSDCCSDFAVVFDDEPPVVTHVADGLQPGIVHIQATATDNLAVARVEFYLDGALVNTDVTAPFEWTWNQTDFAVGTYDLRVVAFDLVDNEAESRSTATIAGAPTTEPASPWGTILVVSLVVLGMALMGTGGWFYYRKQQQQQQHDDRGA